VPKALGFGLRIMAYTPHLAPDALAPIGRATNDLAVLLEASDYVSIHVPLTPQTRGLLGVEQLRHMKPSAYLINTSRGAVIDEAALYQALSEGWIAGAALDVLVHEPPAPSNPLLALANVIVTPHIAFSSAVSVRELQEKAAQQVADVLCGAMPPDIVNSAVLDQATCRFRAHRQR
jgi:D-3-phosphoglycerate dehydrogenase